MILIPALFLYFYRISTHFFCFLPFQLNLYRNPRRHGDLCWKKFTAFGRRTYNPILVLRRGRKPRLPFCSVGSGYPVITRTFVNNADSITTPLPIPRRSATRPQEREPLQKTSQRDRNGCTAAREKIADFASKVEAGTGTAYERTALEKRKGYYLGENEPDSAEGDKSVGYWETKNDRSWREESGLVLFYGP